MANNYNSNPIYIDTTYTGGWKSKQTLNTGNLPVTIQNPTGIPRQWGLEVTKVVWDAPGASATFSVTDPNDSTVLLKGSTPASFVDADVEFDFVNAAKWRDFNVTISAGSLTIWYRA